VISGPCTKESVRLAKRRFFSRLASDEIATRGYRVLTFAKCTIVMTSVLMVTSSLGFSFDYMIWYGWEWDGFGLACVEPYDI
jgi:hypothetical protein